MPKVAKVGQRRCRGRTARHEDTAAAMNVDLLLRPVASDCEVARDVCNVSAVERTTDAQKIGSTRS